MCIKLRGSNSCLHCHLSGTTMHVLFKKKPRVVYSCRKILYMECQIQLHSTLILYSVGKKSNLILICYCVLICLLKQRFFFKDLSLLKIFIFKQGLHFFFQFIYLLFDAIPFNLNCAINICVLICLYSFLKTVHVHLIIKLRALIICNIGNFKYLYIFQINIILNIL